MTGDNYILKTALTYLMKVGKNVWRKTNLRKDFIYLTYKDFTVQDDLFFFFFSHARDWEMYVNILSKMSVQLPANKHHGTNPECSILKGNVGLSWGPSDRESTCQCRRHKFNTWSGKIPHAVEQLIRAGTTATEPVLLSLGATTTGPTCCNYWSLHT